MPASTPGTGSNLYTRYAFESTFNTSPGDGSLSTYFGHNVKFTPTKKRNTERIPDMGTRNYTAYAAKNFEGTWSADFQCSNFYFLKSVFGATAIGGGGPYTHTYTEANTPPSITIQSSENLDTDSEITYTGCVIDKFSMGLKTGEVVSGKLDGKYAKEIKDATLNTTGNSQDSEDVFTFAHATIAWPTATTRFLIQSFDVEITNNAEMIPDMGTIFPTQRAFNQRVYEFKVNKVREADADILDKFYGGTTALTDPALPASTATLTITMTNAGAGTALRSLVTTFATIQVEDPSIPLMPTDVIKENATLYALSLSSCVYTNNTTPHP